MFFVVSSYTMLLLLYIFAFMERSVVPTEGTARARELFRSEKVGLAVLGITSGLTLAALVGDLRTMHSLLLGAMVIGGVLGVIVSRVLIGRPKSGHKQSK